MREELRNQLIKYAEYMKELRIAPIEGYIVLMKDKKYFVSLLNRPPKVFASDDVPLDMDVVMEIK